MALVGEELASNAALDEVLCVCPGRRPIKSCPEGLAEKCPGCSVVPTETGVNFCQELPPLLLGDTPLKDSGSAFLVELSFVNFIGLRTPDYAASLVLIFWELLPMKVGQERFGPRGNYSHDFMGRGCYFGGGASDCV